MSTAINHLPHSSRPVANDCDVQPISRASDPDSTAGATATAGLIVFLLDAAILFLCLGQVIYWAISMPIAQVEGGSLMGWVCHSAVTSVAILQRVPALGLLEI